VCSLLQVCLNTPDSSTFAARVPCGRLLTAYSDADGTRRKDIRPGLQVAVVLKQDQRTGKRTIGVVKDILTSSAIIHWAGLCAAPVILTLSVAVSFNRLDLPSDGWSVGLFEYAGKGCSSR
jgi:uncharacterized repeat protein (TIGR03833 family)